MQPHVAGDGVHSVVTAYIFDEHEYLAVGSRQRAAMHGPRAFVDGFMPAHGVEQRVERGFTERNITA